MSYSKIIFISVGISDAWLRSLVPRYVCSRSCCISASVCWPQDQMMPSSSWCNWRKCPKKQISAAVQVRISTVPRLLSPLQKPLFFHLDLTLSLTKLISLNVCFSCMRYIILLYYSIPCFSACWSMRETTCSWMATCLLFCTWIVRIVKGSLLYAQAVWPHAQNGASILLVVVLPAWELLWLVRRNLFIQDQLEMVNYHKIHLHTQT